MIITSESVELRGLEELKGFLENEIYEQVTTHLELLQITNALSQEFIASRFLETRPIWIESKYQGGSSYEIGVNTSDVTELARELGFRVKTMNIQELDRGEQRASREEVASLLDATPLPAKEEPKAETYIPSFMMGAE